MVTAGARNAWWVALAAASTTAAADIVPTLQERTVDAWGAPNGSHQTFSAPDFNVFVMTAMGSGSGTNGESGGGTAYQDSSIAAGALIASGYANSGAHAGSFSSVGFGRAESLYRVQFTVALPTPIHLVADLRARHEGDLPNTAQASLELKDLATQSVLVSGLAIYSGPTVTSLDETRTLAPGSYQLLIDAKGWSDGIPFGQRFSRSFTSFDASLTVVPAPATLALLGAVPLIRSRRR